MSQLFHDYTIRAVNKGDAAGARLDNAAKKDFEDATRMASILRRRLKFDEGFDFANAFYTTGCPSLGYDKELGQEVLRTPQGVTIDDIYNYLNFLATFDPEVSYPIVHAG